MTVFNNLQTSTVEECICKANKYFVGLLYYFLIQEQARKDLYLKELEKNNLNSVLKAIEIRFYLFSDYLKIWGIKALNMVITFRVSVAN